MNKRLTPKDRGLIKGAMRRAFARSDLHREVLQESVVIHHDPARPRVTRWSRCRQCYGLTPTYKIEIHHLESVVPLDRPLDQMTWDEVVDRLWCDKFGLTAICPKCHNKITAEEKEARKLHKNAAKNSVLKHKKRRDTK